ncbi:TVP38/TMEM64 family protein [Fischerella thermalis]|uniref:TVP38/TMEM64 family membrane protein n=2 Tax=Fischerella TaxID=1190 RepID=G6FZE7_9CYAN|nr:TVP38/TMEM64 family protein [Fischerella thermalis]PLZ84578.1 TVP38/TMEM64 family protein [Fischerella thermalis WC217]EHC08876.1 SNARE associated golgi family protein [Fischerella thermalis JSC-11]PLZ12283.1 TVP38/TMEM64 family protein [Fischerella thermalis WC1110]PLZ15354.1 TVP38/TMEM64 family protein [Fischerella thermalis WC119]PLZ15552.1 TVP38/TMEM64 family protein [Fischerella thermalis WC114]
MHRKPKLKLVLLSCLAVSLIIAAKQLNIQGWLQTSITWIESLGSWGAIAFIIIYNIATLLFIPGSLLTLKGGCLFGVVWGSMYVLIAATIGATFAFIIGRYLTRDWVCRQLEKHPKFKAIDQAVAKQGFKIVFLTRLSPIFPFNLLNYAFGITQVSLKDYILGSIGMIPGTVMYVYIGSLATDLAMISTHHQPTTAETEIGKWLIQIIGLTATVLVTIYVTRIAQKALQKSVDSN